MKKSLILLLSLISMFCWGQQYSQKWSDLDYVGDNIVGHKLDIYLPKTTKSSYPVILYIYGSAWGSNNSKGADMSTVGAALLDAGYAVVCINHRSLSDAKWPAQINDVKAAIRFVRGNAVKYKFDTCFVGISGSSSGGHLSDVAGLSRNVKSFTVGSTTMDIEGTLGSFKGCSSSIDAVCDWFGPKYLIKMDSCGNTTQHGAADSPGSGILGCAIKTCTDNAALLEPKTYIDPSDPPFLIFHGTADAVVPYCASVFLNKDLKAKGVQSEYVEIAGGGHYSNMHTTQNLAKMVTFFNSIKDSRCSAVAQPTVTSPVTYTQNATATPLTATGTSLKWYTTATGGTGSTSAPTPSTTTVGSTDYYVTQTVNGTESPRAKITVTITASQDSPVISITSPANNSKFDAPATITITTSVSDPNNDLIKVEFFNGSSKIGEATASPYSFTWNNVALGTYTITAVATDAANHQTTSTAITVIVINTFKIYKTATAITIDGTIDAAWNNASVLPATAAKVLSGTVTNTTDLSGSFKALWDNTYLYVLADVTDDATYNDSQNAYDDDAVEVYLDLGNDKATTYGTNDVQYTFGWNDGTTIGSLPSGRSTTGITYKAVNKTGGYIVEARIPWSTLSGTPAVDQLVGIDFMINDDDNGSGRDGKISWTAATDDAWEDPSLFGVGILKDVITCTPPDAPTATTPISYAQNATATALTATGTSLLWYTAETGGTGSATAPIPSTTTIGTQNFYVSQTVSGCESSRTKIEVNIKSSQKFSLVKGWNIVGCPIEGSTDIEKALSSIWSQVETVKNLDSFWDIKNNTAFNSLLKLNWGCGYFVKVKAACDLDWTVK